MASSSKTKKIFDGRYEIISIVGRGAGSVVYHARHVNSPTSDLALKVLVDRKDKSSDSDKLRKEALAMVSCRHPYIIRLDDFHAIGELSYLLLEFAPESDLRKYVLKIGGKLPPAQAEEFLRQCAEGLDAIHSAGIIHRDMKPDNILVVNEHEIRIADFGIALLPGEDPSLDELQSGVGTTNYMGPEVLEGRAYDKLSDIYALGLSFYEMITGSHPFEELPLIDQLEARKRILTTPLSQLVPDISPLLSDAIMKCLAFDSKDRFQSAQELAAMLGAGAFGMDEPFLDVDPIFDSSPLDDIWEPLEQSTTSPSVASSSPGYKDTAHRSPITPLEGQQSLDDISHQHDSETTSDEMILEELLDQSFTDPLNAPQEAGDTRSRDTGLSLSASRPGESIGSASTTSINPSFFDTNTSRKLESRDATPNRDESGIDSSNSTLSGVSSSTNLTDDARKSFTGESYEAQPTDPSPFQTIQSTMAHLPFEAADLTVVISHHNTSSSNASSAAHSGRDFKGLDKPSDQTKLVSFASNIAALFSKTGPLNLAKLDVSTFTSFSDKKVIFILAIIVMAVMLISSSLFSSDSGEEAVIKPSQPSPLQTPSDNQFPLMPPGVYAGKISGFVPGEQHPISFIVTSAKNSEGDDLRNIVIIIGSEGWQPPMITLKEQDPNLKSTLRLVSNGFILDLNAKHDGETFHGAYRNATTGATGTWTARAIK